MARPRLLIVDDSVVIRRELTAALARLPGVEVVGSASNGRIALMRIPLLAPDVVVLDIDLPEGDALETLETIRRTWPRLVVVMLNVPSAEGAAQIVDALTRGADDYVMKPAAAVPAAEAFQVLGDQLLAKIESCSRSAWRKQTSSREARAGAAPPSGVSRALSTVPALARRVDVVVIAVSTGGPGALTDLIPTLPADFPVPVLIVQHMPPVFTRLLAERLAAKASVRVAEGCSGEVLAPGDVWIAPGDLHMAVERHGHIVRLVTHREAPENSCRPSADVLFRSVAEVYGLHALAVVMTGMGRDGFLGCEQIHAAGGQVLVQDEGSSVVWGMPGFVARAGMADQIVPLSELGDELVKRARRHRALPDGQRRDAGVPCR